MEDESPTLKIQVIDLHLYLKCHSSAGVFQTFCSKKPNTWFLYKWNIGWKWVNSPKKKLTIFTCYQLRRVVASQCFMVKVCSIEWFFFYNRFIKNWTISFCVLRKFYEHSHTCFFISNHVAKGLTLKML